MSTAFQALGIANMALGAHQTWIDALGNNIANVNTYRATSSAAFQAQFPIFTADPTGGVRVTGVAVSDPLGREVSMPDNPLADQEGHVRAPEIDMASQMSQLIMAQRGYEASVSVTKTAQNTYDAALQIGAK